MRFTTTQHVFLAAGLLLLMAARAAGQDFAPPTDTGGPEGMVQDDGPVMRLPPVEDPFGPPMSPAMDSGLEPAAPAAPGPLAVEPGSPAPRPQGGLPFGAGSGTGPGYEATWMPDEPVRSQAAHLGLLQQYLSVLVPAWKSGPDNLFLTTQVCWDLFDSNAILPDTLRPFPKDLWDIRFGTYYTHDFDNGTKGFVTASVGSASDRPFYGIREMAVNATAFLRVSDGETNAWIWSLVFSTNSQVLYYIPIPGLAYYYAPSEQLQATIGFPFAMVKYHPWERWRFEFKYTMLTTIRARVFYELTSGCSSYAGFDWLTDNYMLYDRVDSDDRFYSYEKRVVAGLRWQAIHNLTFDLSAGYAFDRYYFEGHGFLVTNGHDQVDLGNGPFVAAQLKAIF